MRLGGSVVAVEEQLDEKLFESAFFQKDLEIGPIVFEFEWSMLQPIERGMSCERDAFAGAVSALLPQRLHLAHSGSEEWIKAQSIVVIEVFVAHTQGQPRAERSVRPQSVPRVWVSMVDEALCHFVEQACTCDSLRKDQESPIRRDET